MMKRVLLVGPDFAAVVGDRWAVIVPADVIPDGLNEESESPDLGEPAGSSPDS